MVYIECCCLRSDTVSYVTNSCKCVVCLGKIVLAHH